MYSFAVFSPGVKRGNECFFVASTLGNMQIRTELEEEKSNKIERAWASLPAQSRIVIPA